VGVVVAARSAVVLHRAITAASVIPSLVRSEVPVWFAMVKTAEKMSMVKCSFVSLLLLNPYMLGRLSELQHLLSDLLQHLLLQSLLERLIFSAKDAEEPGDEEREPEPAVLPNVTISVITFPIVIELGC
jgi:hypothetical protein